ncbi:MAG: transcriptional regulator [Cyanobacteriota bacterium]|nr:transcriptional regulator [Cyanobacteriota bacterium]
MKRLDLIIPELELERVRRALRQAGVPGYSVLRHVTGYGTAGVVSEGLEVSGTGANAHVIVFCEPGLLDSLRRVLRPLLGTYGGVAFVGDAEPL